MKNEKERHCIKKALEILGLECKRREKKGCGRDRIKVGYCQMCCAIWEAMSYLRQAQSERNKNEQ